MMGARETFSSAFGHENKKIFRSLYRRLLHEANYLDTHPLVKCLLPLPKHLKVYCGDASSLYTLNGRSYVDIVKRAFLTSAPEKEQANTTQELDIISCDDTLKNEKPFLSQLYQRYSYFSSSIPIQLSETSVSSNHRDTTEESVNYGKLLHDSFDALRRMREHKEWCYRHLSVLIYHQSAVYCEIEQHEASHFLVPDSFNEAKESKYERLKLPFLIREFLIKSAKSTGTERADGAEKPIFNSFPIRRSANLSPLILSYLMGAEKNSQNTNSAFSERIQRSDYSENGQWKQKQKYFQENFFSPTLKGLEYQKKSNNKFGGLPPAFRLWAEPLVWAPSSSFNSSQAISSPAFYDPDMPWGVGTPHTHLSSSFNKPYSDFEGLPLLTHSEKERELPEAITEKISATVPDQTFQDDHSVCGKMRATETAQENTAKIKGNTEQASQKRVRSRQCSRNEKSPISVVIVRRKGRQEGREEGTSVEASIASSSACESRSGTSSTSPYVPSNEPDFPVVSFFTGSFSSSKVLLPTAEILPTGLLPGTVLLAHPCSHSFTRGSRVLLITKRSCVFTTGISLDAECLHSISEKHPIFPEMFWGHPIRNGGAQKTSTTMPPTPNITVLHTLGIPPASFSLKSKERLREAESACKCHSRHCEPLILPGHRGQSTQPASISNHLKGKRKTLDKNVLQKKKYVKEKVEESESVNGSSISATPTLFMSKVESLPYLATLIAQHDHSGKARNFRSTSPSTVSRRAVHVFWGSQRFSTTQLEEDVKAGQWIPVRVSPCFLYAAASFQPSGFSSAHPLPFPSEDSLCCSPFVSTVDSFSKYRKSHSGSSLPTSEVAGKRDPLQDYFPSKEMLVEMKIKREKEWLSSIATTRREKKISLNSTTTTLAHEEEPTPQAWNSFLESRSGSDTYPHSSSIPRSPSFISVGADDEMNKAELNELLEDEDVLSWPHEWKKDELAESRKSIPLWDVLLYALGGEYRSLIGFGVANKTPR